MALILNSPVSSLLLVLLAAGSFEHVVAAGHAGAVVEIEPPTRRFSEIQVIDSVNIYQPATGASVAQFASLLIAMHSCSTQNSRKEMWIEIPANN
jgi:hypothetical protein